MANPQHPGLFGFHGQGGHMQFIAAAGPFVPYTPPPPPPPSLAEFLKWATEARLVDPAEKMKDDVSATLQELENEARRIVEVEFKIPLEFYPPPAEPDSNVDVNLLDSEIHVSLRYAVSPRGIQTPSLAEDVGVFVSDGLVPVELHRELVFHLDALAKREPLDFHPGSHGKIQDIIHPSLYPFVLGESVVTDLSKSSTLPLEKFSTEVEVDNRHGPDTFTSRYSWIPSVFAVSQDGKDVQIQSYINGLGPREQFPRLYRLIEKIFLLSLPHFERTMSFRYQYSESPAVRRWRERFAARGGSGIGVDTPSIKRSRWDSILRSQAEEKVSEAQEEFSSFKETINPIQETPSTTTSAFAGRNLKIIVKVAHYHLKAGQTYDSSTWHMEGMPHERIVAGCIYYYDTDTAIVDEGLDLRRGRDADVDFPPIEEFYHEAFDVRFRPEDASDVDDYEDDYNENQESTSDYPSDWDTEYSTGYLSPYIKLGSVPTTNFVGSGGTTGRILSFPNWIQHRVGHLSVSENAPEDYIAKRKILCFFLVDDDEDHFTSEDKEYHGIKYINLTNQVLTSSDIPYQGRMTNFRTLRILLPFVCRTLIGQTLPPELVQRILDSGDWGYTREEAEQHRRGLMRDRAIGAVVGENHRLDYSLCEH
ncbi:hypothetical protein C8J57DRAFT_1270505 [Mycena rebaudengoi]|nr:hypothetical protein C8J57DRAFT_1270505 [Mycena rebaudengoi]